MKGMLFINWTVNTRPVENMHYVFELTKTQEHHLSLIKKYHKKYNFSHVIINLHTLVVSDVYVLWQARRVFDPIFGNTITFHTERFAPGAYIRSFDKWGIPFIMEDSEKEGYDYMVYVSDFYETEADGGIIKSIDINMFNAAVTAIESEYNSVLANGIVPSKKAITFSKFIHMGDKDEANVFVVRPKLWRLFLSNASELKLNFLHCDAAYLCTNSITGYFTKLIDDIYKHPQKTNRVQGEYPYEVKDTN